MVRVLVAGFKHETNTFARQPTDLDAFRARALVYGAAVGKAFAGTQTEIAAYLDFCATRGWQAVTPVYADASPGGPVTEDAFRHVADTIVDAARDQGPFDAVLLALHGAMVCAHTDDGEGTLLDELRGVVGPGVPVAATLDLHANVTDRMAAGANVLVAYRTYPHIDQAETATRAATIVERALAGRAKPTTTVRRGAMLEGLDGGQTIAPGPMTEALGRADRMLQQPGVLAAGVCAGFVKADTPETGPSAYVVGDGADPRFGALADELMAEVWESRHRRSLDTVTAADAVNRAGMASGIGGPLVLADLADNPGGGGTGDATGLLRAMIDANLPDAAFATICDPASAQICWDNGLGAIVHLELGGKADPAYGPPIAVRATVQALTRGRFAMRGPMAAGVRVELGPTAVVRVGGVDVVVASRRYQAHDAMFFQHAGIDPAAKRVIAVKSAHHFRAAFQPLASGVLLVDDGGGLTSADVKARTYTKVRRPIFPLDMD